VALPPLARPAGSRGRSGWVQVDDLGAGVGPDIPL